MPPAPYRDAVRLPRGPVSPPAGGKRRRLAPPAGYTDIPQHLRLTMGWDAVAESLVIDFERVDGVLRSIAQDIRNDRVRFAHTSLLQVIAHLQHVERYMAQHIEVRPAVEL